MALSWHFAAMACLYILAGMAHWAFPRVYLRILPPWVPLKNAVVWGSGLAEVLLGAALFLAPLREAALWGIMGMLMAFMPVHVHMLRDRRAGSGIPHWALWLRIPVQGVLIWWAASYLGGAMA